MNREAVFFSFVNVNFMVKKSFQKRKQFTQVSLKLCSGEIKIKKNYPRVKSVITESFFFFWGRQSEIFFHFNNDDVFFIFLFS